MYILGMRSMSVSQFKATCLARFDEIAKGGESIVITKRGVPVAHVVPAPAHEPRRRVLGKLAGTVLIDAVPVAPLADVGTDADREVHDEWVGHNA